MSKILGETKIWGEKVVIADESIGVSQLLGVRARDAPRVCAYDHSVSFWKRNKKSLTDTGQGTTIETIDAFFNSA